MSRSSNKATTIPTLRIPIIAGPLSVNNWYGASLGDQKLLNVTF
jgi:hypothetical protein